MTVWQHIMAERMMILTAGLLLDALFGDPVWLYHPVRMIGKLITGLEWLLDRLFRISGEREADQKRKLFAGGLLVLGTVVFSVAVPAGILYLADRIHHGLYLLLSCFFCYQLLAMRSLKAESMKVYTALLQEGLAAGRKAVSMIVGRDTEALTEEGVIKATVETIAENTSDGVIAPLLYMTLLGVPGGFFYKAVNTMDSMVGYKNDRYLYFGRAAARLDDLLNYIPARLAALFMIAAAFLLRMDAKGAVHVWKRDRRKHKSPNSAQTESVCAGALQVQLAGNAYYFGRLYEKPFIGDPIRRIEREDIRRAGKLLVMTTVLFYLCCMACLFLYMALHGKVIL